MSQPTTDKLRLNSHSLDEFVTFMYDAFGLRDGRQHQLQELKSIDALSDMVEKMTRGLAKHLVNNNGKSTDQLMLLGKVRTSIPRTKNENFSHLISMGYQ
ncbi:hypothetical protein EHZ61_13955 [Aeromonas caviae]|uniref:hypothetical protein n=1 Tax=Aeromonas caviae TaxID=648 RepID=UPI000F5D9EF0|nr:hypothetical protein [Aeromonas caviae]RQX21489.1 hypothetical protein EHZ61_13955 [Aeromonas caviae]